MLARMLTILISLFFIGCSSRVNQKFSFEGSSAEVHYEPVDSSGMFVDHQVIHDPLRDQYEKGPWEKSGQSKASAMSADPTTKNRINIVFVGDGYTKSELQQYGADVQSVLGLISKSDPFKEYLPYFSFHRVDVISKDSGVSQEIQGQTKNTALGMSYYCSGIQRLLCINASKAAKEAQNAPAVDSIFALANSSVYGGAGYRSPAVSTLAARNPAAVELALHEFGHSFALLGDEYEYKGSAQSCLQFPNVSPGTRNEMLNGQSKWFRWLDLPNISAFQGACYSMSYYRPTENSKMRSLGQPFEEVNYEQFILAIYKKVRPVDSSTKEGKLKGNQVIEVHPMQPVSHKLSVQWSVDGVGMPSFNGMDKLDTAALRLSPGTHKINAVVVDRTLSVRDEDARALLMTQKLEWRLKL